ncbi:hypothetical protein CHLRE_24g755547v5 [Chlamydomonas reinhardtii]|uniref:Uncharacterized protein n=1 Tax=Chlamydomonas reinhardtii TaxID=3055 RepID=A0A2K3CN47_CHLRE|nr:uncharacterized protein CHLRE_24g755547v5 [Chlamydomonas reinhardtii]PNW69695.1 hypothetical protein CHLRE_24g755547v5 [Chlamydomonas reinhardtii]
MWFPRIHAWALKHKKPWQNRVDWKAAVKEQKEQEEKDKKMNKKKDKGQQEEEED